MKLATIVNVCCISLASCSLLFGAEAGKSSQSGSYQGDVLPEQATPAWKLLSGKAAESIEEGKWIIRQPSNFSRGIDLGKIDRRDGQENVVEIRWATTCQNNLAADGLRIHTQGRLFRIHPLDRTDGKDMLLTGTSGGMSPAIEQAQVDLSKFPSFDAAKLNTYRVRWVTNADDSYGFQLSINGKPAGTLHGEPYPDSDPRRAKLGVEMRSGTHTIESISWNLHRGGKPIVQKLVIADHAQLLLDNHWVERYGRLKRTMHQPVMHPDNPVLSPSEPWEYAAILLWGTVIHDEQDKIFKMWYMTWGQDPGGAIPGYFTPVCYATSQDGVHWKRPKLRLSNFKYHDPRNLKGPVLEAPVNNIVYNDTNSPRGMDSPTVVKDLSDPDPQRRYKMSYWHRLPAGTGIFQSYSPDGIHWTRLPKIVVHSGDRNTLHFDPFHQKWVVITRPGGTFYELEKFGKSNNNFARVTINVDAVDRKKYPDCRMYSCPVINYEGMQLAFPEIYSLKLNRWISYLAWSYDGVKWHRDPERVKFMPWGEVPGTFDCWRRNIHNGGMIRRDDKLWVYFSGRSQGKNVEGSAGYLVPSGEPGFDPRGIIGAVGIGILRVDGFCSRDADSAGGSLLSKPCEFHGNRLLLNADIHEGGSIKASLLDPESHREIKGYGVGPLRIASRRQDRAPGILERQGRHRLAGRPAGPYLFRAKKRRPVFLTRERVVNPDYS